MSQQFGGAWGDIVAAGGFVQTPETVYPTPGVTVSMGRAPGLDLASAHLSSTGQHVSPNSLGIILVPVGDVAALRSAGWIEVSPDRFISPLNQTP